MRLELAADQLIAERLRDHIAITSELLSDPLHANAIAEIADLISAAFRRGNKLILFGNGGSAADAQHLAAEMTGRYLKERAALPAISLTANTSSLTAIANDYCFDMVFARQVEALGRAGDVAVGISTSGNSRNVICAIEAARRGGLTAIALTGIGGGRLRSVADYCFAVPSAETPRIQEAHILIGHIICELVENELSTL
jgi:D-sedoheptulose 7-phosphate isomerase